MKLNKKGFTLLELIIVIIIIGVLASMALPRFFKTVEFSRSAEALNSLGTIRRSVERCALMAGSNTGTQCNNITNLDIANPGSSAGTHFTYSITTADSAGTITVVATRNTVDGGTNGDTITLTATTASITRSGTGNFSGIK
ncbi:MAG: prepilin-type N-terminal cleavage/methylation domain-containing protein [Candidatus Omnitrophica bacterium]|nr:prepilin-type N-terminal cleavage/methylation domain-containing protein [Candidatus Omnitrophota bacterium]